MRTPSVAFLLFSAVVLCGVVLLPVWILSPWAVGEQNPAGMANSISTDVVLPMLLPIVEATLLYTEQNAAPEISALTQGMAPYLRGFPPSAEPGMADLLGLLSSQGSPPFVMSGGYVGRGWCVNSSMGANPIALLAASQGYENLSIAVMSPVVLDISGTAKPDKTTDVSSPHLYAFDTATTALFDMDGDGYVDLTEWIRPDLALLVVPDSPGSIVQDGGVWASLGPLSGRDLVGTVGGYRNGFEHLLIFDLNHDLRIAGQELDPFFLWMDANGNGLADTGELFKPQDLNIAELIIPETGLQGTFARTDTSTGAMWDWWPSFAPIRPNPAIVNPSRKTSYWQLLTLEGVVESLGTADLETTLPTALASSSYHGRPDLLDLSGLGLNARESLLACLDSSGTHIACVDYRPEPPHTARIWILTRQDGSTWQVCRFPLPEGDVKQVTFDDAGGQCLAIAGSQVYVLTGWGGGPGVLMRGKVKWFNDSFRPWWGSAFAARDSNHMVSGEYYVPGYIHQAAGAPRCDAVMRLVVNGAQVTLTPVSDIHALAGEYLPSLGTGLERGYAYFLESPGLSFVLARNAEQETTLVAVTAGAPGDWQAQELDKALAITGLSASGARVEYVAERGLGQWEVCWGEVAGPGKAFAHELRIPTPQRPSYPELGDSGTRLLWIEFDWPQGTLHGSHQFIWGVAKAGRESDGSQGEAKAQSAPIGGPWRVAEAAPLYAAQTTEGILVFYGPGDANHSGQVDALDVQLVINAALEIIFGANYDLDDDGEVNAVDVQMVINAVLGML